MSTKYTRVKKKAIQSKRLVYYRVRLIKQKTRAQRSAAAAAAASSSWIFCYFRRISRLCNTTEERAFNTSLFFFFCRTPSPSPTYPPATHNPPSPLRTDYGSTSRLTRLPSHCSYGSVLLKCFKKHHYDGTTATRNRSSSSSSSAECYPDQ